MSHDLKLNDAVIITTNTVDGGRTPARKPVELGSLSHDLRRVLAPSQAVPDCFHQQYEPSTLVD